MNKKIPDQDIINRLLISKYLLDDIRSLPTVNPDRYTVARYILTAHGAAELSIAGIFHHLGLSLKSPQTYLMDYFGLIKKEHSHDDVPGQSYFSQLNTVRNAFKHSGVFPEPKQWFRVGDKTYGYISDWCKKYLNISFDDLDESDMISDADAKKYYDVARKFFIQGDYKAVLENLAFALHSIFQNNMALPNLRVGDPLAEDAIKLSAYGVHANEFLRLQEFLPNAYESAIGNQVIISWQQNKFGHPGNWQQHTVEFCLKTFVNIALRIQDAAWIPGALKFDLLYEHKITALINNVEIVREQTEGFLAPKEKNVLHILKEGETIRGEVKQKGDPLMAALMHQEYKPIMLFTNYKLGIIEGEFDPSQVHIICVPRENEFVNKYFPDLPELEFIS